MKYLKFSALALLVIGAFSLTGCAAIQHRNLEVSAKMSETIFLDAEKLSENNKVYVRVTNTSDFQEINFGDVLKGKLSAKGRVVTPNPKEAAYIVQANVLYIGEEKQDMTYEGAIAGGYGGAIAGAIMARNSGLGNQLLVGGATGLVAAGVGALAGSMIHVDSYVGVCDIQLKEQVDGGVVGKVTSNLKQGNGTEVHTERKTESDKQEYRTRIGVKAVQTNIDRKVAAETIADRLASQISGLF